MNPAPAARGRTARRSREPFANDPPDGGRGRSRPARLIASPIKLSGTPVTYRQAPPTLGRHTDEVLGERLGLGEAALRDLRDRGIV